MAGNCGADRHRDVDKGDVASAPPTSPGLGHEEVSTYINAPSTAASSSGNPPIVHSRINLLAIPSLCRRNGIVEVWGFAPCMNDRVEDVKEHPSVFAC